MERRDSRTRYTSSMEEYLEDYGYHINKKLFDWAVSMMKDRSGNKLAAWDKEKCDDFLRARGINLRRGKGHDAAYVLNMARADYYGSSIADEQRLALFVRDYLDDPDGSETRAFDELYIKTVALGEPIFWEEML